MLGSADKADDEGGSDMDAMVLGTGTSFGEEVGEGVWEMGRE